MAPQAMAQSPTSSDSHSEQVGVDVDMSATSAPWAGNPNACIEHWEASPRFSGCRAPQ